MIDRGEHSVLGVNIKAVDYTEAVSRIVDAGRRRVPLGVSALAVHGVMTGVDDDVHRHRLNDLELVVPDGQPVRWALNLLHGAGLGDRVYGPNLMLRTCEAAADNGMSIFLFGGTEELLDQLSTNLAEQFPDLKIAGSRASKFRTLSAEEKAVLVDEIVGSGASITFAGIGCPRQEVWAYEFKDDLSMPILAVGAAFNFHAGLLDQAPPVLQRWGFEWLYRFAKEPRRLWRRYVLLNPRYMALVALQRFRPGLDRFDPGATVMPTEEILYG